jgi:hypothetical protein
MAMHHDAFFKEVFGRPEHAAADLRAVLPAELIAVRIGFPGAWTVAGSEEPARAVRRAE